MTFDTIIRGGNIDVVIADGVIADVAPGGELGDGAKEVIDATGLHVLPGLIDAHVHLNDPGRADWEGFASGDARARGRRLHVRARHAAQLLPADGPRRRLRGQARPRRTGNAHVDFALWGGLVPGSVERMDELAACGVVGFQAFMADSGNDDFAACDDLTLFEGMCRAAKLELPVAVHAENGVIVRELGRRALAGGHNAMADFLASRPVAAEVEAITSALAHGRRGRLRAAHLARLLRHHRRARGRGPRAGGRRHLRDVPALPRADRRGRRADRRPRQVHAARCATPTSARGCGAPFASGRSI